MPVSNSIRLLARTSKSISVLDIDVNSPDKSMSTVLVPSILEDINVILAANVDKNTGYYLSRGILFSVDLLTGKNVEMGKIGHHFDDFPSTIDIDWISGMLYIGVEGDHESGGRIEACRLDDLSSCTVVLHEHLDYLHSLLLDPGNGRMFWQSGVTNNIEMASMNGSDHERMPFKIASQRNGVGFPSRLRSLSFHTPSNRLFVVRSFGTDSEVLACQVDSPRSCSVIAISEDIIHLVVSETHLIWSMSVHGVIMHCEIDRCEQTKTRTSFNGVEIFIALDSNKTSKAKDHVCSRSKGDCSHFCLLSGSQKSCSCPIGIVMEKDGKTCNRRGVEKMLFVSSLNGIHKISLDTSDSVAIPLQFENKESLMRVDDLEFDGGTKKLYWIEDMKLEKLDGLRRVIKRSNENGTAIETLIEIPSTVRKIRLDVASKNLFWMDEAPTSRIGATSLTTLYSKTIVFGNLKNAKSFVVNSNDQSIIVARDGESGGVIEKFDFDGSKTQSMTTLQKGSWISDINMDVDRGILYWTETNTTDFVWMDMKSGMINRIAFESKYRLPQPTSIAVLGDTVYINSLLGRSILKISLKDLDYPMMSIIDTPIFGAKGMHAVDSGIRSIQQNSCSRINGYCEQICVPKNQKSHTCACADNYYLSETSQKCVNYDSFFITLGSNNQIYKIPIDGSPYAEILKSSHTNIFRTVNAIDVDMASSEIVLAGTINDGSGQIARIGIPKQMKKNTVDPLIMSTVILSDQSLIGIYDLAVDRVSRNIYWSNAVTNRIEVCDRTGMYRKVLAWQRIQPRSIALDVMQKALYFYDDSANRSIKKMSMNGERMGGVEVITHLRPILSMTIDEENEQIYWVEYQDSYAISMGDIDGSSREILYVGRDQKPMSISLLNGVPYFAENNGVEGRIGMYNGRSLRTVQQGLAEIQNHKIFNRNEKLKKQEQSSQCFHGHSKCDQLCLVQEETTTLTPYTTQSPYRDYCTCADHFVYDNSPVGINAQQCDPYPNVIIATKTDGFYAVGLRRQPGKTLSWKQDPVIRLPIRLKRQVKSMSYHASDRAVFWIEKDDLSRIYFSNVDRPQEISSISAHTTSLCTHFHSITVDSAGNQLFTSCYRNATGFIIVYGITANPTGLKYIGVIISGDASASATGIPSQPRDIAVFPLRNVLFYVDASLKETLSSSIIKCTLDGKKCSVWHAEDILSTTRLQADPNIESSRLFYTSKSGIWSRDVASAMSHVRHHYLASSDTTDYTVAPIDDYSILVSAQTHGKSNVIDWPSNDTVSDLSNSTLLLRFAAFKVQSKTCRNARCSDMCRYARDKDSPSHEKFECLCPTGSAISNDNHRVCVASVTCLPWQFTCANGRQCIHAGKKCDRVNDCRDQSDESTSMCHNSADEWPCDDGRGYVNRTNLCDGFTHCADASDELHCRCERPHETFDCGAWSHSTSTKCVPRTSLCDRINDCENGEDEKHMMCMRFGTIPNEAQWFYVLLLIIVVLLVLLLIVFCFARHDKSLARTTTSNVGTIRNEASTLLVPHMTSGRVLITPDQIALSGAYSVTDSSSTCVALPPPNSSISASKKSSSVDIPPHRFYAPPPSTASLSTYGVVRPTEIRMNPRGRPSRRHRTHSPSSSEDGHLPLTSTPRSMAASQRNRIVEYPRGRPPPLPFTPIAPPHSSSSMSSHSSENMLQV